MADACTVYHSTYMHTIHMYLCSNYIVNIKHLNIQRGLDYHTESVQCRPIQSKENCISWLELIQEIHTDLIHNNEYCMHVCFL